MEKLLTVKEAAVLLGIHPDTLRLYVREGKIKHSILGRVIRIRPSDLDTFVTASEVGVNIVAGTKKLS